MKNLEIHFAGSSDMLVCHGLANGRRVLDPMTRACADDGDVVEGWQLLQLGATSVSWRYARLHYRLGPRSKACRV